MKKIVITGGHLTPALALLEELKKNDHQIYFFGRKYSTEGGSNFSAEYKLLSGQNVNFVNITTGRLQRKFTKYTIPSLLKLPVGFAQSFIYLLKIRPSLVVSFGGYLSTPAIFSGWLLGIDSITHEQTSTPGLATKINSLFAKRVLLSWPDSQKDFPKDKTEVIGNLVRKSIFKKKAKDEKVQKFLNKNGKLIFVTGGNIGSHFLNRIIFDLIPKLDEFLIFHQVGTTNFNGDTERSRRIKRQNYLAVDYIDSENIGAVFARADLTISRSGANTIWDLAVLSKVAILIPLLISANKEQQKNAEILKSAGSAIVINQDECTPERLHTEIKSVLENLKAFQKNAQVFNKTLPNGASAKLATYINDKIKM